VQVGIENIEQSLMRQAIAIVGQGDECFDPGVQRSTLPL
jgi:hypothetical protein